MPDSDVLKRSVTAQDYPRDPRSGILHFFMPTWGLGSAPDLPPFWSAGRDAMLLATLYREAMWESAVTIAIAKKCTQDWMIDSDGDLRSKRAHKLLLEMNSGRGWVSGLERHLQAYLLTGNGGHIEIVRATGAPGSRILGLVPLDPLRCLRTGDADIPLLYRDRPGNLHELRDYQTFNVTDMPDPQELWYGCGHCAAERAYYKIITMEGLERYLSEKITGRRPLDLHIINGLSTQQITTALRTAQEDAQSKGQTNYMGAAIAAVIDPTSPPGLVTIPFASLPDGFDAVNERKEAKLLYADALGIDPQELDPSLMGSGALGTGAQSVVLAEKEKGKGLYKWDKAWAYNVNYHVLDERTTFYFQENDLRDRKQNAEIFSAHTAALSTLVKDGALTPLQALNYLVDTEEIPREYLPSDVTADETLTDVEKPQTDVEQAAPAKGAEAETMPTVPPPPPDEAKERLVALKELAEQIKLARQQPEAGLAGLIQVDHMTQAVKESPPVVNVAPPIVNVPPVDMQPIADALTAMAHTMASIAPPNVTVDMQPIADAISRIGDAKPPVVNVTPQITVTSPARDRVVERNAQGLIVRIVEEE